MNLVSIKNLSKAHGGAELFSDITFGLEAGGRVALIGANGTGKSTLLRIIAGLEPPDSGTVSRRSDLRTAYLPQIPVFDPGSEIMGHILSGDSPVVRTVREYEVCVHRMSLGKESHAELDRLSGEMDRLSGWDLEHRVRSVLDKLGISDPGLGMGTLSGGMVRKVELARALTGEFDLLLLDEPTNHLDPGTVEWLQDELSRTSSAVFLVTHDRYFLESLCSRIFELDERKLYSYEGNYSTYLEKRSERLATEERRQQRLGSVLRRELVWLKRGPRARTGKDRHRQETVHAMIDSVVKTDEDRMVFASASRRLGKKVLEVKNLSKSFGEKNILRNFSFSFEKGARLGILGPNGSGKSTFLKLLMGRLEPDSGTVESGINTKFAYFDQLSEEMNGELTVYSYLSDYADEIRRAGGEAASVATLLEDFRFPESRHRTPIRYLSGGERRRLYLLKLLVPAPNFLLFDEPTNDLDIGTLSLLEDFLENFEGCCVAVSHDRYFLDRVADLLLVFDGSGTVRSFTGSASEYLASGEPEKPEISAIPVKRDASRYRVAAEDSGAVSAGFIGGVSDGTPVGDSADPERFRKKLTFREQKEFETLLPELEALEAEKRELEILFSSDDATPGELRTAQTRYSWVLERIESKTLRWEELAERNG